MDETINNLFTSFTEPFVNFIFAAFPGTTFPWIVLWLVVAASIFTVYFRFIQFRLFGQAVKIVFRDKKKSNDGEVSHFQALVTALSGTVGLGNIAGVAVAIGIGGPGATFWMIVAGLLGMASKFTECTLAVKYRQVHSDGRISGGPMYYLSSGLTERGIPGGSVLATGFALFCVFGSLGGGNMFQANQAHAQLANMLGDYPGWITGTILGLLVFVVIVGGIKSIARVTEKIVPFMALLYVGTALVVILMNADRIGWAFQQIFAGAFTGAGVAGGAVGALIQGLKRAAFSNEAGVGSAAIAHSAAITDKPVDEGLVSLLEPFIDTVVICTMTALVIIISGQLIFDPTANIYVTAGDHIATLDNNRGVALTSAAFGSTISWFPQLLAIAVILFAFSTMIAWSYYGLKCWTYLFGENASNELVFKLLFCCMVVVGASSNLEPVIEFADASIFAMSVFNIIGLYLLMRVVKNELVKL